MGDGKALHRPCCLENGVTEDDHGADCDDHPGNVRLRNQRAYRARLAELNAAIRFTPPPVIRFGPRVILDPPPLFDPSAIGPA